MSYSSEVLADSPLGYWRQGDATAATMTDSSGNGHHGIAYAGTVTLGATGLLVGDSDTCADFTAGNGAVNGAAWMSSPTAVTVEAIIKPDTVSGSSYNFIAVRDDNNGTGNLWWLVLKAGKLTALCRGSEVAGATTIVAGTTYHVAFTYDGTTAKLYVNGALDGSAARSGSMSTGNNDLLIGRWGSPGAPLYFDGKIDEVAYYGTALSGTRIAAHYTAATTSPDATVNAAPFTATATAVAPTVTASSSVAAPAASATATFNTPAVTGTGSATVFAAPFTASASVAAPALSADANPSTPAATAIAAFLTPTVSATTSATVTAVPFAAMADFLVPTVSDGSGNRTVTAPAMTATAGFLAPVWTQVLDVATDTTNARHGRRRLASATVTITRPVVAPPATLTFGTKVDKALAYPVPTMVEGRPT